MGIGGIVIGIVGDRKGNIQSFRACGIRGGGGIGHGQGSHVIAGCGIDDGGILNAGKDQIDIGIGGNRPAVCDHEDVVDIKTAVGINVAGGGHDAGMGKGSGCGVYRTVAKGKGGAAGTRGIECPGKVGVCPEGIIAYFCCVKGNGDVVARVGDIDAV